MPTLNFKKRFASAVENGTKRQTIRARRRDGRDPRKSELLYLYTGQRTKACRKLGEAVCTAVKPVVIFANSVNLDRIDLLPEQREAFAKADGFGSFDELVDWFANENGRSFPWFGLVIEWINI